MEAGACTYLIVYCPQDAGLHEAQAAVLLDELAGGLPFRSGVCKLGRALEFGTLWGGGAGGRRRGRLRRGVLLQELLAPRQALLEVLVRPPAFPRRGGSAGSACDICLQQRGREVVSLAQQELGGWVESGAGWCRPG